jgi:peptide/nickel transport system permease protein
MKALHDFWEKYKKKKIGIVGLIIIIFFIALAIAAPILPIPSPTQTTGQIDDPPSLQHPFGTNDLGEDMLSLCIWSIKISLITGIFASIIIVIIGLIVGIYSGYYGGFLDEIFMRLTDFFLVLPSLVLIIVITALFGSNLLNVILIIGLLSWPTTARIVRSMTLSLKERQFIEASKISNAPNYYIIFKHIFPNVYSVIIATAILNISGAIFTQASLVFLGVGNLTDLSWGLLLHNAFQNGDIISGYWWTSFFPGLFLVLLILGFVFIGRSLEEILNPKRSE